MSEPSSSDIESSTFAKAKDSNKFLEVIKKAVNKPRELLKEVNNISVPTKKEDLYMVDASEREFQPEAYPNEPKGKMIERLFDFLKQRNMLPKPGFGAEYPSSWQYADIDSEQIMYGEKLPGGANSNIFYDEKTNELTHLWGKYPTEEVAKQNVHQMELYRRLDGKHPFFKFVREVPGGWTAEYFPNQGNLKEYLDNGGKLTKEQIEKAVDNLREMQNLAGEAHGDIVGRPDYVDGFNRMLIQKKLDTIEPYGFLEFNNILVGLNGELIIIDYAGHSNPSSVGGWNEVDRNNTKSNLFMHNELQFFSEGLHQILEKQQSKIPIEQTATV